jgi:HAE1 family hydrophobic/amphiphilic exporter-1/multidrug efflux pump
MLSATILAIFFVPMFFVVVLRLFGRHGERDTSTDRDTDAAEPQGA